VLLDVREDDEWEAGHIAGSVHIPMYELPTRLTEVPADSPLVVVCKVGGRSAQVVAWLAQQGYDATNLDGGVLAWTAAKRPLVRADGSPGLVA
jgi:rhodanese-related sulfurtransferase